MADQLLTGTTLVENTSRSAGDIAIGGIIEWDGTYTNIPEGFRECDGATVNDPTSVYDGQDLPNLNTQYITIAPVEFAPIYGGSTGDRYTKSTSSRKITLESASDDPELFVNLNLPHGSTITGVIVYGSDSTNTWDLRRNKLSDATTADLATDDVNTEGTTITTGVVDNETYCYWLQCLIGLTDFIYGARVTYTPRFKFIMRIK